MDRYTPIKCQNCYSVGKTRVLGRLYQGSISLQSMPNPNRREYVGLLGTSFDITCPCSQIILTRDQNIIHVSPLILGTIPD